MQLLTITCSPNCSVSDKDVNRKKASDTDDDSAGTTDVREKQILYPILNIQGQNQFT